VEAFATYFFFSCKRGFMADKIPVLTQAFFDYFFCAGFGNHAVRAK
jgi:hypothetical protein